MDDISAARWRRGRDPNEHKPIDALKEAIRQIEAGELAPKHIIVCFTDEDDRFGWFQAGPESRFGQVGILYATAGEMIGEQ